MLGLDVLEWNLHGCEKTCRVHTAACLWRGSNTSSAGRGAWLPTPATLGDAGQNAEPSCLRGWSGQGHTPLCKCCPLKGVAAWAVGAADGSRALLRHRENAHPQGQAGKLLLPGQQPLGTIPERETLGEGISPCVCTNWRPVCCHGPRKDAKPGMLLHVLGEHSLGAQLALVP